MKNLLIIFISIITVSCSNEPVRSQNENGFEYNGMFYALNNFYFTHDRTTSRNDDFFLYFTDGEIISINADNNELILSENSSLLLSFRAIQNPNTPNALNFAPSGAYQFNSKNELLEHISFKLNCQSIQGSFASCETEIEITSLNTNSTGAILEIFKDSSSGTNYSFTFELINGEIVEGQFNGERSSPVE